jgi:hypothetical protein
LEGWDERSVERVLNTPRAGSGRDRTASTGAGFPNSAIAWLGLVALLVLVHLFIRFVGAGLERDLRVVLFSLPSVAGFGLAGLLGVWLAHHTGFPAAWDPHISNRQRFLYPALIGLGFGILLVVREQLAPGIPLFLERTGLPAFNAPFPGSVLFYGGGAIIVEVFYRLLPIPLVLWLVSHILLRGRAQEQTFWVLALLTSLIEPMTQELGLLDEGRSGLFAVHFTMGYMLNLAQAVMFRRYGFLAAITLRWAMYLVWHILYGNLICGC